MSDATFAISSASGPVLALVQFAPGQVPVPTTLPLHTAANPANAPMPTAAPNGATELRASAPPYAYNRPFLQPAPVWDYWFALLFPLLIAVCVVYKAVKVAHIRELPRQAAVMFGWILLALVGAAVGLSLFVRWTS